MRSFRTTLTFLVVVVSGVSASFFGLSDFSLILYLTVWVTVDLLGKSLLGVLLPIRLECLYQFIDEFRGQGYTLDHDPARRLSPEIETDEIQGELVGTVADRGEVGPHACHLIRLDDDLRSSIFFVPFLSHGPSVSHNAKCPASLPSAPLLRVLKTYFPRSSMEGGVP